MNPTPDNNFTAALARRDELQEKSRGLAERAGRLTALKTERDQAQAELDTLMRSDAEQLTGWAKAGANGKPPAPDARAREAALRKLANAEQQARSVDAALAEAQQEQMALAEELKAAANGVRIARAQHLTQILSNLTAQRRENQDAQSITDALAGQIQQALFASDAAIGTAALTDLERLRVEWLNTRDERIATEIARRTAEILGGIPS